MLANHPNFLSHLLTLQLLDFSCAPFLPCPETWNLGMAMVERVNKKELMCLARNLGGLVPEEWPTLLIPHTHSLHFRLFAYPHLEPFAEI